MTTDTFPTDQQIDEMLREREHTHTHPTIPAPASAWEQSAEYDILTKFGGSWRKR